MGLPIGAFDFEYLPTEVVFGRGCVYDVARKMEDRGLSRALVVCGTNVGANRDVIDPVESGLGDRMVGVFAETTPEKEIGTVLTGVDRMQEERIDCVLAVGGGSSINVARAMCLLEALDRPLDDVVAEARKTGTFPVPGGDVQLTPNVIVPTTMAGADLTYDGGIRLPAESPESPSDGTGRPSGSTADPRLMPAAVLYDPDLFATTPVDVLTSSAMNGFNKGIETVYSRRANPLTVAHALQGLRYFHSGLPGLREAPPGDESIDYSVVGIVLVQYGRHTNIVHTFGNGVSSRYDVQQGTVHGIVVPHVLRYVFDRVDANRRQLAEALSVEPDGKTDGQIADAIVDEVVAIRDALGLPSRLQSVEGLERDHLPSVSAAIADNRKHARNPPEIDPSPDEILEILRASW